MIQKYIKHLIATAIVIASIAGFTVYQSALGNQSMLPAHTACQTSSATSSPATLSTSTASSVLTCDSFLLTTSNYRPIAVDSAVLAIQFNSASTTGANLTTKIQYSNDAIDWYGDNLGGNVLATTTGSYAIGADKTITWTATATGTVSLKLLDVRTPMRYVRAIFTNPLGTATSSVWAEFVPKQESNN